MVVGLALAATLVYLAIDLVTASGGAVKTQGFATAAFTPLVESTHNNAGDSVCAAGFVPSEQPAENQGDLNARRGSFLESVQLPEGATVSQLTLFANDNDGDDDVYAFLVRKQIKRGLSPQFNGYRVMAKTNSTGAALNKMREFTDTTIDGATIDNTRFYYFIELVNCAVTEPFSVEIAYTP